MYKIHFPKNIKELNKNFEKIYNYTMEFQKFLVIFLNTKQKYFFKTHKFTSKHSQNIKIHHIKYKMIHKN